MTARACVVYLRGPARVIAQNNTGRAIMSERTSVKRELARQRHAAHYKALLGRANQLYLMGGDAIKKGLALFDRERSNIESGQAWAASHYEENETCAELCSLYATRGGFLFSLRQHPLDRIHWQEAGLAAAQRLQNRSHEAIHLCNLGLAFAALGETHRAIELYERAMAIERSIGDERGVGTNLNNLALAYAELGEIGCAIEYHEQHLALARRIGDHRGEGYALLSLGLAWADLGETQRAIEYYEQSLALASQSGDRYQVGTILASLGIANAALGDLSRAIVCYEEYLVIARETGDIGSEATAFFNMSLILDTLGERERAIRQAEAALKIFEHLRSPVAETIRCQLAEYRGPS
jgi:tetratricopeptide (TPR) repeat protein